ncbi:DNA polymerase delta, subunit 4-domain-containing protein [Mycena epipterygia]|nr:DNA polymerase delta, subunit 4-domain-containing protein [Mycena epipterygia]
MPKSSSKSKTVSSPSLKQATLSFSASKRTGSNNSSKKVGQRAPPTLSSQHVVEVDSDSEEIDVDDIELSSDDDEVEVIESEEPVEKESPRPKAAASKQRSVVKVARPRDQATKAIPDALLELDEKDTRWRGHIAAVRAKRGYLQLIHAEDQDKFHDILRVFDLSYEYGPCVGVSRLERWERASALGLNPPPEVRDILTTREGSKDTSYSQSVFFEQV